MKKTKFAHIILMLVMLPLVATFLAGCATQRNTSRGRWWHSFNTRYNIYYNATLAYIDGSLEKEQGNKDNYTEQIPPYTVGNKNSRELGKSNYDRAVEKCKKAIQLHSIKKRPEWDKNRKETPKDIEWLNRREYNPFLWKAWLLMGRSQFYEGDFESAATTFAYMARLYATQPAIYGRARAWLAKCYVELGWLYDAEDVTRDTHRDSVHWRARKEWDYTLADYYIHLKDYDQAIPYLRQVIKHEMRRKQKAREYYLLGQLLNTQGEKEEAYRAFRSVLRQHPPYELSFNARIAMTEVKASGNSKSMIRKLKRMAASDNNKDYLDQVYYAIGNIYLSDGDTLSAIAVYEEGNKKATRTGVEKGVLLLRLGNLYWQKEKYSDAQRCYGEAIGLLDPEREDYQELSERSKKLDELVPHIETIHLQDSLQALAKMPEEERNAAIDHAIEALKKKEKEERDKLAEQEIQQIQSQNLSGTLQNQRLNQDGTTTTTNSTWYFYNPTAVSQGKATFQRQWGKRENVDNWQRTNVTVVATTPTETEETEEETTGESQEKDTKKNVDKESDPHQQEYYLAQIPFTEEQKAASDNLLTDALYQAGVIMKDKMEMPAAAEKLLIRLVEQYPDFASMDNVYYHLFLLYSRQGDTMQAQNYLRLLENQFPRSEWTTLLTDPYYQENARKGVEIEDSLYAATYRAFRDSRYSEVNGNVRISERRFSKGANRDKFLFVGALSQLYGGDVDSCVAGMKAVVAQYPDSRLSEMAGMIINGVNAGRKLQGGKFDLADVWNYRTLTANDQDSTQIKEFSEEQDTPFLFLFVYSPDSVNENQLLFEVAKFNFTTYLARGFDITIEQQQGLHRMQLSGFRNYQEARQYARAAYNQPSIMRQLGNGRGLVISQTNLELIGTHKTYADYDLFYTQHFAILQPVSSPLLQEPDVIVTEPERTPDTSYEEEFASPSTSRNAEEGTFLIPEEESPTSNEPTTLEIPTEQETNTSTVLPVETNEDVMEIPAEQETGTPTVPQTEINEDVLEVPTEQETNASMVSPAETNNGVMGVPVEQETDTPTAPQNGTNEDVLEIPTEQEVNTPIAPSTQTNEGVVEIQEEQEVQTPQRAQAQSDVLEIPLESTPQEQTEAVQPSSSDDIEIYFDDDVDLPADTPANTKQRKEQERFDLDDEYYDLDGF